MKKFFERLKSSKGETLVEAMASILVVTMASIVLLSMISSAAKINKEVDELSQTYTAGQQYVERGEGTPDSTANVTIKLYYPGNESGEDLGRTQVSVYKDEASGLYAFYKAD